MIHVTGERQKNRTVFWTHVDSHHKLPNFMYCVNDTTPNPKSPIELFFIIILGNCRLNLIRKYNMHKHLILT